MVLSMLYIEPKHSLLNPKFHCVYCNLKTHSSHLCRRYNSPELFFDHVFKERRCKNCLRQFHRAENCYNDSFCVIQSCNRKDKHSPSICRKRFPKQNNNESFSLRERSKFYHQTQKVNSNEENNLIPNQMDTHSLTVTAIKSEKKFISQATQTDEDQSQSSHIRPLRSQYSDHFGNGLSSLLDVCGYDLIFSRLIEYLKIPCSKYCSCRIHNSTPFKVKASDPTTSSSKDFFMNILI